MEDSRIEIQVKTDENKLPTDLLWKAEGKTDPESAKAMFLSLWDGEAKNTMKIDLWVKDMSIEEMKQFFHQTMLTMADTFERATGETNICEDLRDYCFHFAEKMKIMPEQ